AQSKRGCWELRAGAAALPVAPGLGTAARWDGEGPAAAGPARSRAQGPSRSSRGAGWLPCVGSHPGAGFARGPSCALSPPAHRSPHPSCQPILPPAQARCHDSSHSPGRPLSHGLGTPGGENLPAEVEKRSNRGGWQRAAPPGPAALGCNSRCPAEQGIPCPGAGASAGPSARRCPWLPSPLPWLGLPPALPLGE
uniref:Uncharacterized protein n=1 Tax=Nothoprocta perdicaria TaxID=30464 RepID=A0A8C6ZE76_NOTPE